VTGAHTSLRRPPGRPWPGGTLERGSGPGRGSTSSEARAGLLHSHQITQCHGLHQAAAGAGRPGQCGQSSVVSPSQKDQTGDWAHPAHSVIGRDGERDTKHGYVDFQHQFTTSSGVGAPKQHKKGTHEAAWLQVFNSPIILLILCC
jgi:hypothetical protein